MHVVSLQGYGVPIKRTFLKKLQVCRSPPSLCIHFNRTLWVPAGFLHKSNLHISFPVTLNVSKLLRKGSPPVEYMLCAVVEHTGGPSSGHYLTYRRCGKKGKQWVCASDTSVHSVTINDVLKAEAYMLFYQST